MLRSHGLMNIVYRVDTVVIVQINGSGESIQILTNLRLKLQVLVLFPRILALYLQGSCIVHSSSGILDFISLARIA